MQAPVIFITGTNTGVGKTLLTGLLLECLRSTGVEALAIKPFCSGGFGDARILRRLQPRTLRLHEISPYRYRLPLSPGVAAEIEGPRVRLMTSVGYVERIRGRCECLLVEGCGGLLSPLGERYSAREMIMRIGGHVIVVAPNRLGAINHALLTVCALESLPIASLRVVLMGTEQREGLASKTNLGALVKRLACGVVSLPYLGENACEIRRLRANSRFLKKTLAALLPSDSVSALLKAAVVEAPAKNSEKSALTSDRDTIDFASQAF